VVVIIWYSQDMVVWFCPDRVACMRMMSCSAFTTTNLQSWPETRTLGRAKRDVDIWHVIRLQSHVANAALYRRDYGVVHLAF
jgi:hypothetical protein